MRWVECVAYVEMTNIAEGVLHVAHRLYQGTLHFQNVIVSEYMREYNLMCPHKQ
jgi:hypothetical protein